MTSSSPSSARNGNANGRWIPDDRLPPSILEGAEEVGIRTLGVPEEFGGIELDRAPR